MVVLLSVSGDCPKCGRKVTRKAPANRVTWRGECPNPRCDGKVIARAPKAETPAETPAEKTLPKKKGIPRVGYSEDEKLTSRRRPPVVPPADPGDGTATADNGDIKPGESGESSPPAGPPPAVDGGEGNSKLAKRRRYGWSNPYDNLGY